MTLQEKETKFKEIFSKYSVSRNGEVRSLKTNQLIKPQIHESRGIFYLRYNLCGYKVMSHILTWVYYNGLIPEGLQVNHKDHDTFHRNIDNLELNTYQENQNNRRRVGRYKKGTL